MLADDFLESLDGVLAVANLTRYPGEEFADPPLDVLRYHARPVRLARWPVLGRGMSVVAVARQPIDTLRDGGVAVGLARLASAVHGRFPPWPKGPGLSLALSAILCTSEPITASDDETLARTIESTGSTRSRVVPLALFRVNLAQEAMAMALAGGPADLFPELDPLTEFLTGRFQRFVPLMGPF